MAGGGLCDGTFCTVVNPDPRLVQQGDGNTSTFDGQSYHRIDDNMTLIMFFVIREGNGIDLQNRTLVVGSMEDCRRRSGHETIHQCFSSLGQGPPGRARSPMSLIEWLLYREGRGDAYQVGRHCCLWRRLVWIITVTAIRIGICAPRRRCRPLSRSPRPEALVPVAPGTPEKQTSSVQKKRPFITGDCARHSPESCRLDRMVAAMMVLVV
eukprot:scaffold2518_cov178-Amphora_coffeaeformis.AAC.19